MLRQRLKQWGVNNKNKKPARSRKSVRDNRVYASGSQVERLLSTLAVQRSVSTSPEDFRGRRLLKAMDDYFEHAWESRLPVKAGVDAVNTLARIYQAVELAASSDSRYGWALLKKAGSAIQRADFSQISPKTISSLIRIACPWRSSRHTMQYKIFNVVSTLLSQCLGELHPVALLLGSFSRNEVDLSMCVRLLASSAIKTAAHCLNAEEKEMMTTRSMSTLIYMLWDVEGHEMMENILKTWSPTREESEANRLLGLAVLKLRGRQYREAQDLCSAALPLARGNVWILIRIYDCYTGSLCRQKLYKEALGVFLNGVDHIKEVVAFSGRRYRTMVIEWLRKTSTELQRDHRDFRSLDQINEKLEAMSLETRADPRSRLR